MDIIVNFLSRSVQFFYDITLVLGIPSYGIAIILVGVALKLVVLPLTIKQVKAMRMMQKLQPEIQEIQKKHKNNPQKAQQMIMEVYKKHKANPLSGCWPILIQMPIFISLFFALRVFFEPGQAPYYVDLGNVSFLWLDNLGAPDPTFILPVLVAAATFLQQKITMSISVQQHPIQNVLLYTLPLVVGFVSLQFPSALALYWLTFSIVGALEQLFIRRFADKKEEATSK